MATLTAVPLGLPSHTKQVISPPLWNKPAVFATGFSTGFTMNKSPRRPNYQVQASTKTDQEILRKRANFAPNMWGDHFNTITSSTFSEYESYTREVNVLKEEVKDMLMAATRNPVQNIHLIDLLSRLGLAYHYETEIELQLHHIFYGEDNIFRDHDYDLDTMARLFRLCRHWWKDTNLASECPYTRDRIVEMYGWAAISTFEPYYGRARIIYTKTIMLQSAMDDGYDSYGTPEELESFTEAIQRWDMSAMDLLPDYLKNYYRILLNHYEELDKEMTAEGRPYSVSRLKELVKEVSDAYHKETQWFDKGYIPPFNEYMMTARITGSCQVITAASFVGMENATADAFEWLQSSRRLIMAVNTILRLTNDILSHKREQTTGESASSIECYMRQYSLSEEEVIENFEKTIANQWKIINEEFMKPTPISNHLVSVAINQARSCGPWFQFGDAYTEPEYAKDIISLIWYKDTIDIESNFLYARDRLLESFLVGIGTFFEPQYARPWIIMGKLVKLITILDDTFDAYGTLGA
uniref:Sesquiterpene synthase 6 n=1 Tax=Tripterygium wilfordii TaxID=458696 RepID=A0A7S5GI43_TRIWF|nr:sesquiterpene synthase 6 [Tripterygium wilfordii]